MKRYSRWIIVLCAVFIVSCGNGETTPTTTPASELDAAEHALKSFFLALSRNDYKEAARYHLAPNPLVFLYDDVDPGDAEALLTRACTPSEQSWCVFYCWKIKDVVSRQRVAFNEYVFDVRFEDESGKLLTTGDNVTPAPCIPPGCSREEFIYQVKKVDEKFLVDGIPVFLGCWP